MNSIAVDSSALIAIVLDEPEGSKMLAALTTCDLVFISTATWLETQIVVNVRAPQRVATLLAIVDALAYEFVAVDAAQIEIAIAAFLKYGKGRHAAALDFGDFFSYAMARSLNLPLLFKGNDFSRTDIASAIASAPNK
jgi:ribonuclease VapC